MLPYHGTVPITAYELLYGWKNWLACRVIHELDYVLPKHCVGLTTKIDA